MTKTWIMNDDMTANVETLKPSGVGTATALPMTEEQAKEIEKRLEKRAPFGFVAPETKTKRRKA